MITSAWCPSCRCGWHKPIDAFDVTPPEGVCLNPECSCHKTFWQSIELLPENEKRAMWGDR